MFPVDISFSVDAFQENALAFEAQMIINNQIKNV